MSEVLDPEPPVDSEKSDQQSVKQTGSRWDEFLAELSVSVREIQTSLENGIEEKVASPFQKVLADASAESRKALTHFERNSSNIDTASDRWRAVAAYRKAVETHAITSVARHLRDGRPGETMAEAFQEAFSHLADRSDSAPEDLEIGEVGQALRGRSGDSRSRRLRKSIARRFYRAKPAPVRMLARYHLQVRVSRALSKKRERSQEQLAACLVRLETAISMWTYATLAAEESLDEGAGIVDPSHSVRRSESKTDGQDNGLEEMPYQELRSKIISGGSELADSLEAAAGDLADLYSPFSEEDLADLHRFLDYDVRAIGTFLLREKDRETPDPDWLPSALAVKADSLWTGYQEESRNRIRLNQHLLRIRATLIEVLESILNEVQAATVVPLREICSRLVESIEVDASKIDALFDTADEDQDREKIIEQLQNVVEGAAAQAREVSAELGGINAADAALRGLGLAEWERSRRDVDQLPSKTEIHAVDVDGEPRPKLTGPRSSVNMKQIVKEVLAIRFADQLKRPAKQLRRVVARRWGDVVMVAETVAFNTRAAAEKLEDDASPESFEEARKVVKDGLNRALERARGAAKALDGPWADFNGAAVEVMMNLWRLIHRRVKAAELEPDQWSDIGSRLSVVSQSYWLRILDGWSRVRKYLHVLGRFLRMKGSTLIRKGQSAVGVSVSKPAEITATIDAIRNFEEVDENMPFIYRRLFTLDALQDPAFLEGRSADIQEVRKHFERWQDGNQASVLILSSKLGSGRTSFLNALEKLAFDGARLFSVHLTDRCRTEEELADTIADAMELSVDRPASFASLRRKLTARPRRGDPIVCRFYELEHTVLAVPGGTRLLSDLLVFLSATDQHVYWIGGISELCRQFLERTSLIEGLAQFHDLSPLSAEEFEALILTRHRRSGIELTFEPPRGLSTLMRQRLNRAASDEDRQEILKEAFFDRLSNFADQDLRLALFAWLQSVRFGEKDDTASVEWRLALDFSFLTNFDRQLAFSLRSMLFHKTLTVEEHAEIFRMSVDQSIVVMESLLNSGLITASDSEGGHTQQIEVDRRYRIHPLMQGPVRQQLVGWHMVY